MYPLAKNEGNFLLMYPLFVFPYLRTLRAVFSLVHCFYADFEGVPANVAEGYINKASWGLQGLTLASQGLPGWILVSCGLLG